MHGCGVDPASPVLVATVSCKCSNGCSCDLTKDDTTFKCVPLNCDFRSTFDKTKENAPRNAAQNAAYNMYQHGRSTEGILVIKDAKCQTCSSNLRSLNSLGEAFPARF